MMTLANMRLIPMRLLTVFALLAISTAHVAAQTANTTANDLMPGCRDVLSKSTSDPAVVFYRVMCLGAVGAIIDTDEKVCPPKNSTHGQAIRVVVSYIDARPERQHERFNKFAQEALRKAWPCQR